MINDGKGDEVVETLLGHLFFLYIKYNRDLSFISAGFLGEVGCPFDKLHFNLIDESAVSNESLKDKKYANENEPSSNLLDDYLNYYISFSSKRASRSTLINENPDKNKSSFRM